MNEIVNNVMYSSLLEQGYKPDHTKKIPTFGHDNWLLMVKHFEHPVHGPCNVSQWIKLNERK